MSSSFEFQFSGDDIEGENVNQLVTSESQEAKSTDPTPPLHEAKCHSLEQMVSHLPSSISHNFLEIPLSNDVLPNYHLPNAAKPPFYSHGTNYVYYLPRREVFDIHAQLMAEDDESHTEADRTSTLISGLEQGDINPRVYEGGFKTWECTLDLVRYLTEILVPSLFDPVNSLTTMTKDIHIIELGAGTALPSLSLLLHLFSHLQTQSPSAPSSPPLNIHFTFCDYNASVLALATLPNLLLAWAQSWNQLPSPTDPNATDLEFPIEENTRLSLIRALSQRHITITFVSGAWSPTFVDLVESGSQHLSPSRKTLILASETIYSPSSLPSFTETLRALLHGASNATASLHSKPDASAQTMALKPDAMALVAAKRIYFGVGGGVVDFVAMAEEKGLVVKEEWATDEQDAVWEAGKRAGVERVILEIKVG